MSLQLLRSNLFELINKLKTNNEFSQISVEEMFNGNVSACLEKIADHSEMLLPEEKKIVETVVQKRREEFSTGRLCAHTAMRSVLSQANQAPLLPGSKREPLWPEGLIGSISHSADCCVAVVSSDPTIKSLGIDIEKREGIKTGVRDLICLPEELSLLGEFEQNPEAWKLIFSAKESVYKALFPVLQKWIGFSDATLYFDFQEQRFVASMNEKLDLPPTIGSSVSGRFSISSSYILTIVEIP